jgi:hypothetical protein
MNRFFLLLIFILLNISHISGQGTIRGKVSDENGEPLIGATVVIRAAQLTGTTTDLDGNYSIKVIETTPVLLEVSYIGYDLIQDTVNPQKGEVIIKNYGMNMVSNAIGEITVVGKASKGRDSYMEKVKLTSGSFIDFISTETIKKAGDSNVSTAVSRITGVSSYGGFITVRGIGDRYIKTQVNGMRIPTLDPFTNNIKLDLFPSSLVDNIIINKTASPDLPGDWAGAYLSIETKEYPEKFTLNVESAFGYNSQATFRQIISSQKSGTDWLGFDNGFRNINHVQTDSYESYNYSEEYREFAIALGLEDYLASMGIDETTPWIEDYTKLSLVELGFLSKANINDNSEFNAAFTEFKNSDIRKEAMETISDEAIKVGESLPNTWLPISRKAPIDFSQSFSVGNQSLLFEKQIGYLFGIRYYTYSQFSNDSFTGRTGNRVTEKTDLNASDFYHTYGTGDLGNEVSGWSALFNVAMKLNSNNNISFLFMPNLIGGNKARRDFVYSMTSGSPTSYYTEAQQYESRRQLVWQVRTDHYLPAIKTKILFNASLTDGDSEAPDHKQILYEVQSGSQIPVRLYNYNLAKSSWRFFRELSEDLFDANLSAIIPLGDNPSLLRKATFGSSFQRLVRHADQRYYYLPQAATLDEIENGDLVDYLSLDKYSTYNPDGSLLRYYEQKSGPLQNTIGFSTNLAGFIMADYSIIPSLKVSGGLRVENIKLHTDIVYFYEQRLPVDDPRRVADLDTREIINPGITNDLFFLPGLNIIYHVRQDNLNPINLRFNYSRTIGLPSLRELTPFLVYDYALLGYVTGNSELKPVSINNLDIRGEAFFESGNNLSGSIFYKRFHNHIELIREDKVDIYYSWQNADLSSVTGIEIEGRIGLTKNLDFRANATFIRSTTKLLNDTVNQVMYGQAPYIINAMLSYASEKNGFEVSASYNLQGPKLVIKGETNEYPDIYELPRNIIDLNIVKKLGKHFSVNFKIRDLLNSQQTRAYKFPEGFADFDTYAYGTSYQLGISYKIQ